MKANELNEKLENLCLLYRERFSTMEDLIEGVRQLVEELPDGSASRWLSGWAASKFDNDEEKKYIILAAYTAGVGAMEL